MIEFLILYTFIITSISIIIFSFIAKKIDFFDVADSRKIHFGKIPLIGGLSILLSIYFFSFFLNFSYNLKLIIFSSLIVFIISMIDDFINIRPIYRLLFQIISSLIIVGGGLTINSLGSYSFISNLELGTISVLFTIFSVTVFINANNFIDGIDGLCGSYLIISFLSLFFYTSVELDVYYLYFFIILITALISFLIFNLNIVPNTKIFLGDAGSITLGFVLAWTLILFSESNYFEHPILAIWIVAYPIFDLISVVIIRILKKENPFFPDKNHLHHILINLNIDHKMILLIIILINLYFQISGFFIYKFLGPDYSIAIFIFYLFSYLIATKYLLNKNNSL